MLEILATLNDQASTGLSALSQNILGVGEAGGTAQAGLTGLQNIIGGGLVAGAGLAIGAITGIGVAAFDVAGEVKSAAGDIQSQLGLTGDEAERAADIAAAVWGNNFAGSIDEAGDALVQVRKQLGALNDQELQTSTENAFRLADTFGNDVGENIQAAGVLMDEFGLSSDQAFDFITAGFQRGLNNSDDFLDSIGEYSNLFADSGFSAEEFFSIMESGAAGGVLGTDKINDAIKEMGIILGEGGDDARAAFDQIGLDFDQISGFVAAGDETWADYFDNIVSGLNNIDDPIERQKAQVAIFGTMAEDLGVSFTDGLTAAGVALDDMAGSTAALDVRYNSLGEATEGYKRKALLALEPIGAILLNIANQIMPLVDQAFAFFQTNIVPILETAAGVIQGFFNNLSEGMTPLDAFIGAIEGLAPPEVIAFLVSLRDEILPGLSEWFTTNIQPILDMVAGFVSWQDILIVLAGVVLSIVIPAVLSLIASLAPLLLAIGAAVAIVALMRTAWEENWGGIQEKVAAVIAFVQNLITTVFTAIQEFWAANGDQILAKAAEIWAAIQEAVSIAITFVQNLITTVFTAIAEFWAAHGDQILAKAAEIWAAIQEAVTVAITLIQETITTIATAIAEFWAAHGEQIKATAEEFWNAIKDFISGIWDTIKSLFEAFRSAFEGDWRGFGEGLRETWEELWNTVVEFLGNLWAMMKPYFMAAWENIKSWWQNIDWAGLGRDLVQGVANGISSGAGAIVDAARSAALAALEAAKGLLGIESPSKVAAAEVGLPFDQGIALPIAKAENIKAAVGSMAGVLFGEMDAIQSQMAARAAAITGGLTPAIGPNGRAGAVTGGLTPAAATPGGMAAVMLQLAAMSNGPKLPPALAPERLAAAFPTPRPAPAGGGSGSGGGVQVGDINIHITIRADNMTRIDETRLKQMIDSTAKDSVKKALKESGRRADIIRRVR